MANTVWREIVNIINTVIITYSDRIESKHIHLSTNVQGLNLPIKWKIFRLVHKDITDTLFKKHLKETDSERQASQMYTRQMGALKKPGEQHWC